MRVSRTDFPLQGSTVARAAEWLAGVCREADACRLCPEIPEARPVFRAAASARLLIVGQAPGRAVHASGVPWDDPSGELLRRWLELERTDFYDAARIAIVPAGLCYPGRLPRAGDRPPPPRCAALWQPRFCAALPELGLVLAVGAAALRHWLPGAGSVDAAVRRGLAQAGASAMGEAGRPLPVFPLPHPSPRNRRWLSQRPWFEEETLPRLRAELRRALAGTPAQA